MSWNDFIVNPKEILGHYCQPPELQLIEVYRLILDRDRELELVFEPSTYPENPSPRWPSGSNTVLVAMQATGVSQIEIKGWSYNIFGNLSIPKVDAATTLMFDGDIGLKAVCSWLYVSKVSGYCKDRSEV